MINEYLRFIQESSKPDVLYHAASLLTKTLKPRKSVIGTVGKGRQKYASKEWEKTAVYAATEKHMAIPFGLERVNIMWPHTYTEKEVRSWKKGCYLNTEDGRILKVCYWNHIPTIPFYLYTVDAKDFKFINDLKDAVIKQWYSLKEVTPLDVEKLYPKQVKEHWKIISDKDWEYKLTRYKEKGFYK